MLFRSLYHPDIIGYDKLLHFLCGAFWGFAGLFLWLPMEKKSHCGEIAIALISGMFVGILWEIYEYVIATYPYTSIYLIDTGCDLVADALGAILAAAVYKVGK